jgi:alpha-N-arabinofuranosidase
MNHRLLQFLLICTTATLAAREYHVALSGDNAHDGSVARPLRTIQRAADLAQPGDTITVHAGTYRERINPPRGGTSDSRRITYQAAPGAKVEIKGSEVVTGWTEIQAGVWKVTLPNSFFGGFNPYADLIRGDWFNGKGREHHTGAVYINGEWLSEAAKLEHLLNPASRAAGTPAPAKPATEPLWFAQVEQGQTTLWTQGRGANLNDQVVEINVRRTVFYPDQPGRNFITVRGFTLRHAATPWAPPTAEQIGLIGTHWSMGWIVEGNTISHSICSGIALGKHGDEFDNTSANTAEGYVKTIERGHVHALAWTRANIGHHVVRNNRISHCEQAGIVGSLGPAFSRIIGNTIHDIHVRRLFTGAEMAGIKFHAAIDTEISGNHIFRTCRGLWLDWMAQGTRVTRNLFHDNAGEDLFMEVNHGPFLIDNNLFLSPTTLLDMSQGGAYAHNLIAGRIISTEELRRETPYHPPHSTAVAGLAKTHGGDNRFYNNLFVGTGAAPVAAPKLDERHRRVSGHGLWVYDVREHASYTGGNVYLHGARPSARETAALDLPQTNPQVKLVPAGADHFLELQFGAEESRVATQRVTTALLGRARIPNLPYENPDGSPLAVDTDYFGRKRDAARPTAGPFEQPGTGPLRLKVR